VRFTVTDKTEKNVPSGDVGSGISRLVVFSLDDRRFAVALTAVKRVERIAAVTPLPKAPAIVAGIINFHGQVIPVVDIRSRFNLPSREPELNDHLLVMDTGRRTLAFIVDSAEGVIDASAVQYADRESVLPGLEYVKGVVKLEDGMVLIHDPETFLSLEEEHALDTVMRETGREK
jgi:purine-binding chemotaxis protein CheW